VGLGKHGKTRCGRARGWNDSEARLRAEECVIAAKEEGIAKEDIEEEVGNLVDYMSAAIEKAVNADVDRAVMKDRS
jgi:hypothetical protein